MDGEFVGSSHRNPIKETIMKSKGLKWFGITLIIAGVIFGMVMAGNYLFDPSNRKAWVKPGIAQEEIPPGIDTTVAFTNVTVIPMDSDRVLEGQTVVIEDSRITDIGTSASIEIPIGAHVVDGEGRFLIPGLSDMMTHTSGSENDLLVYLATGITTIRIMGNDPPDVLEWRDEIRAGTRYGPNIWVWWPQIQNNPVWPEAEYESATRGGKTWVHTVEEAEQYVAELAALGVDGIKAHVVFSQDIYTALVESATEQGLPFDGHAPDGLVQRWLTSLTVSQDMLGFWNEFRTLEVPALAHIEELIKMVSFSDVSARQASDASINQIAQDVAHDGMWISTTVHLFTTWGDIAADQDGLLAATPEIKYLHPDVFYTWGYYGTTYVNLGSSPYLTNYVDAQEKMLLALNNNGALLLSGTDAVVPMMVPGFSLHDELETMANSGLSPYEVLKTSTYNPALYLGELEEFGTVEVGKRADLVLLEANPLDDIANTRQVAGTMVRGRWYSRADLEIMLEKVAKDYERLKTTQTILKIVFWIAVGLLLTVPSWFIVRRMRQRIST